MTHLPVRWLPTVPGRGRCDLCDGPLEISVAEVHGYDLQATPHEDVPLPLQPLVMRGPFVLCPECQRAVGITPGDDLVDVARLENRHRWAWRRFFGEAGVPLRAALFRVEVVQE